MDDSILENGKMTKDMDKELKNIRMVIYTEEGSWVDELKALVSMSGPMVKVTQANGFKDPKKEKEPG